MEFSPDERLRFIEASEIRRQQRNNELWLDYQAKTNSRLKREAEAHVAAYTTICRSRKRH